MNGIDNPIVFYPVSILMILFAIAAIAFRNIFYSLLSAIMVFFLAGVLFYVLGSEYNAVIQIAIYGLAVPVILGLAIMFTNPKNNVDKPNSKLTFAMCFILGLFVIASFSIIRFGLEIPDFYGVNPVSAMSAFGSGIFVKYVWAFELMSLILTIIVVGLSLFKRRNNG
ncbi:MAG: NADH-quinone oxidoreductase subunit J [Candidatus Gastranaerophilales bacterium]|nr:NADH-quinone oxidoreductase subunit J [Candidatus Gastranaerophilales bacterium]MCM1073149.1 NADH-quinone oxidoreductase subunit J [Bacteroides sp.]